MGDYPIIKDTLLLVFTFFLNWFFVFLGKDE